MKINYYQLDFLCKMGIAGGILFMILTILIVIGGLIKIIFKI